MTLRDAALALVLVVASLSSGCAGSLLTSDEDPTDIYRLRYAPPERKGDPLPLVLQVARPRAGTTLDTDRIAIAPGGNRFDYYAGARWSETAPQMFQRVLVDALTADGRFEAVLAAPARVPAEMLLDVELRRFEAVAPVNDSAPVVHVQIQATLVDSRRAARILTFVSEASAPASENRMTSVVDAFGAASAKVIEDVLQRLRDAPVSVDSPRPAKAAATP